MIYIVAAATALLCGIFCCMCQKGQKTNARHSNGTVTQQPQQQNLHNLQQQQLQLQLQLQQQQQQQQQINSVYRDLYFPRKNLTEDSDPPPSYDSVVNLPSTHNS